MMKNKTAVSPVKAGADAAPAVDSHWTAPMSAALPEPAWARKHPAPALLAALKACKAAVEDSSRPPSARMELVRDIATPVIAQAEGGQP